MGRRAYDRWRVALAAMGLLISAYLTLLHFDAGIPLVCGEGQFVDCRQVVTSPSSVMLGVPVAACGVVWFLVALALARASLRLEGAVESPRLRSACRRRSDGSASVRLSAPRWTVGHYGIRSAPVCCVWRSRFPPVCCSTACGA